MHCKNCNAELKHTDKFCHVCGAKVIRNRLTLKNVWHDVSQQVFNVDNTFLKTLKHLFVRPEEVIIEYISGTRKRYMNPISYFAIAITLSGLMFFILRDVYHLNLTESSINDNQAPELNFVFDYQGIVSYLIMPVYAVMTYILFRGSNKFNYTEHLVANAYIIGQTSYVQVVTYTLVLGLFPIKFDMFNFIFLFFMVVYQFYALARMHEIGFWGAFWRAALYMIMLMVVMLGIGVVVVIIALFTGMVTMADFVQQ